MQSYLAKRERPMSCQDGCDFLELFLGIGIGPTDSCQPLRLGPRRTTTVGALLLHTQGGFPFPNLTSLPNLWFAKHEIDRDHENDADDEDNSDSYKQGAEDWISGNHGYDKNDDDHGSPGVQTSRSPNTGFRNTRLHTLDSRSSQWALPSQDQMFSMVDHCPLAMCRCGKTAH